MSSLFSRANFCHEQVLQIEGIPLLSYQRVAPNDKPVVLFLTGGGVLARIAYGHAEADPRDFLDHWLAERGWSLIAPSYPSDHDVFTRAVPDLTLSGWAQAVAALVDHAVPQCSRRPLVVAGWSMGGKAAFAVSRELKRRGRTIECFVSLAATPPFPRLDSTMSPPQGLTDEGLWNFESIGRDGVKREKRWLADLAQIGEVEGRPVMSAAVFRRNYRCNVPPGLWGPEVEPFFSSRNHPDVATDLREASSFSGSDYPLCVSMIPTAAIDYRHALADEVTWGQVTIQSLINNYLPGMHSIESLPGDDWVRLREEIVASPRRLSRYVRGGHFFFVGSHGARATVDHLADLVNEARELERLVRSFAEKANTGRVQN